MLNCSKLKQKLFFFQKWPKTIWDWCYNVGSVVKQQTKIFLRLALLGKANMRVWPGLEKSTCPLVIKIFEFCVYQIQHSIWHTGWYRKSNSKNFLAMQWHCVQSNFDYFRMVMEKKFEQFPVLSAEEQIRRIFDDNWRIIFISSPYKHML